jgi:hypothetical protein
VRTRKGDAPMWPVVITVVIVVPLLIVAWLRVRRR